MISPARVARGARAHRRGCDAEQAACAALVADGWTVLGTRLRTPVGEIDLVARRADLLAFIEVKARPSLTEAAWALTARQRQRLLLAAEALLAANPAWQAASMRFDVMLVDAAGKVRRVADAFRAEVTQL
jgi:putative endonuclease